EVFRKGTHLQPLAPQLENVIAVVSDCPLSLDIPCLSPNGISVIADVIVERIIPIQRRRDSSRADKPHRSA
ncbi:MAG: hypothetical protein MUO24_12645, partial [Desulfobacterales bacterium]|nr:hypothetical protein [Desulfobacterales bacterium]